MRIALLALAACRSAHVTPAAPGVDPAAAAAEQVAECLHWLGEEPYDDERGLEIADAVERVCPVALARAREQRAALEANPAWAADLEALEASQVHGFVE